MTFTLPSTPCHGRAAHRPIRTIIVDDHTLVRAGLRRLIQDADSIEVVGEARDANEALAMVESHRPDLVLMDIAMPPGVNGLEATARIKARFPDTRVIVLSMHSSAEYALQALRAGASGYLLKNSAPGEIGVAIRAVMNGGLYF